MRAALALIAEKGPAGFTFADAARWAGVSAAAPYRHYRDREELLADVARRGFDEFTDRLSKAWDDGKPDPQIGLSATGQDLSCLCALRAGFLLRDVRGGGSAGRQSGTPCRR